MRDDLPTIRFTTADRGLPIVRDSATGLITVPLTMRDAQAAPVGRLNLLLDGSSAELLYAGLSRALDGEDPKGCAP
ncbi:hypothetical protein [Embleya sp. AB8]|uniref:hypothetical protein n=1 Tax=Embleya sp. AB8 TaxID=3156304 RepID=UPI003C7441CE